MVVCVSLVLMIKDKEKKEISPEKNSNYLRMFPRKKKNNDGLPRAVCGTCTYRVEKAYIIRAIYHVCNRYKRLSKAIDI